MMRSLFEAARAALKNRLKAFFTFGTKSASCVRVIHCAIREKPHQYGGIASSGPVVANDPVNHTDPSGDYICSGGSDQCGALKSALGKIQGALADKSLSKSDRGRLKGALNFYGKEGQKNGVVVLFAKSSDISKASVGATSTAFTKRTPAGNVMVAITDRFNELYNSMGRGEPKYSKIDGSVERAGLVAHEGDHGERFKAGATLRDYKANADAWEHAARMTGNAVNKAYGSPSVCEVDDDC